MFKNFILLCFLVITGCASLPNSQIIGEGKFFQMRSNNILILQMSTDSPAICSKQGSEIKSKPGLEWTCSLVSGENTLPFSFVMTNVFTSQSNVVRARTHEACKLFISEMQKDPGVKAFSYSECEYQP